MEFSEKMTLNKEWLQLKEKIIHLENEINQCDISYNLVAMLIAAEDHRFKNHLGIDLISIIRAFWRNLFCRKREGASTIAMQLVRVLRGRYERTLKRKLSEMYLAVLLTKNIKKNNIPKLYLFVAYYGWRMNGLIEASSRLELDVSNLNDHDAASMVARLKYPEPKNHSKNHHDKIMSRKAYILMKMNSRKKTSYLIE